MAPVEEEVLDEVRRRRAEGEDGRQRRGLDPGRGALRGRLAAERERPARRTADPAHRRPDLELAGLGLRAAAAPPREARRACRRNCSPARASAYLDAVIKETLRLRPPVPVVVRRLLEPATLGGYDLPAGTTVAPCVYLIHHREDDLPEDPASFVPERFLDQRAAAPTPGSPSAAAPAAASPPATPNMEMKRVLRTVLEEVELRAGRVALRAGHARARSPSAPPSSGLVDRRAADPRLRMSAEYRPDHRRRRRQGGRDRDQGPRPQQPRPRPALDDGRSRGPSPPPPGRAATA